MDLRAPAAALGILAAGLLGAAPACAAPAWLSPAKLGDTGKGALAPRPELAIDAAGEAVAVWERRAHGSSVIQAASRPPGGTWSAPAVLSRKGQEVGEPEIAVDAAGRAVAVWQRSFRGDVIVDSASRAPGGAWSRPVDISEKGGRAMVSQVAVDPDGTAIAVWQRFDGRNTVVQGASQPSAGAWSRPVNLSAGGQEALGPQVAVGAGGAAVAVWRHVSGFKVVVQSASRRPGGAWTKPVDVSRKGEEAFAPQVAIDSAGEAVAVWEQSGGDGYSVEAATRPPGRAWSRPASLSPKGSDATSPQVAVDDAGEAVAVWKSRGEYSIVQGAARPSGGAWSRPVALSANGGNAIEPQIALDGAGEAIAVWQRSDGRGFIVESAARPPAAAWSAPTLLSAKGREGEEPQVAVAAGGEAVAVWGRFVGSEMIVEGAARPGARRSAPIQAQNRDLIGFERLAEGRRGLLPTQRTAQLDEGDRAEDRRDAELDHPVGEHRGGRL